MKPNTKSLKQIILQYRAELHQGLNELAGHGTAEEQFRRAILQWVSETVVGKDARMGEDALAYDELVGARKWQERQREILRKEGLKDESDI